MCSFEAELVESRDFLIFKGIFPPRYLVFNYMDPMDKTSHGTNAYRSFPELCRPCACLRSLSAVSLLRPEAILPLVAERMDTQNLRGPEVEISSEPMEICSAGVVSQPETEAAESGRVWTAEEWAEKMRLEGVPVTITWKDGGSNVQVWGSWDNWSTRRTMLHDAYGCYLLLILPPGRYEYYFILDRNSSYPDEVYFNVHHELEVFEREERRSGDAFLSTRLAILDQGPESPKSSYTCDYFTVEDFEKEPPLLPPHLSTTVLNSTHLEGEPSVIAAPHYATVNHVFRDITAHRIPGPGMCGCLGSTERFRSKYVSMVLYKPEL